MEVIARVEGVCFVGEAGAVAVCSAQFILMEQPEVFQPVGMSCQALSIIASIDQQHSKLCLLH